MRLMACFTLIKHNFPSTRSWTCPASADAFRGQINKVHSVDRRCPLGNRTFPFKYGNYVDENTDSSLDKS